ncbi:MAG: glycerol-3-phosphate 1-O-acyltransferase PlsY [Clostridiales bacterium]|nr:glycerol-3-phosphate 1-O-acyltransferase PlsY [Clostridiales bacterium]
MTYFVIVIAYALGNFTTSYIVGKLMGNIDIRKHGSGNAGSTNVFRTLGKKAGALAFAGDALKGILAVYLGMLVGGQILAMTCGVVVVIGHNWPVVLKFKGGKGMATSIGVGLMLYPIPASICILFAVALIAIFKMVSLGSVVSMLLLPFVLMIFEDRNTVIFGTILGTMAIYRHRANIYRIFKGVERKI